MKNSIKIKFSIFLAVILMITVAFLSLFILNGIKKNQKQQYEEYLMHQGKIANTYLRQLYIEKSGMDPKLFINDYGRELALQLSSISGLPISIYNNSEKEVGSSIVIIDKTDIRDTLSFALSNKIAYQIIGDSLLYFVPLKLDDVQVGAVQFHFSLEKNNELYRKIETLFIQVGTGAFILSFILSFFYFNSFASAILKLKNMTDKIRRGNYDISILNRKDELGRLSEGIHFMSCHIRKNIEDMKKEQEKLSLVGKQQRQFIGNITHEFKTPITSIKAYLDLMEMYPNDEKLFKDGVNIIRTENLRLYDMVEKILQLAELEKYDFDYQNERIDVVEIIESTSNSLKGKIEKFGINLEKNLTTAFVWADTMCMTYIITNLLDNAIKYNSPKGKIFIGSFLQNDRVYIEIRDTGIGIPKEHREKIFEPFYRVDKSRSRQNGGTGLGLSLVKRLVEKQNGFITLLDKNEAGTSFLLSFPEYKK